MNNDPKSTSIAHDIKQTMLCPFCRSSHILYKAKVGLWECMSCEERFENIAVSPLRRLDDKAANPKRIFFSYGHDRNKELVLFFKADLEKRGHVIWFDAKEIGTWNDWKGSITRGIDGSELTIAFMSKHALRDPGVCRNEIAISMNRFGTIYPIAVEPNIYDEIPLTIRHLQWPDLSQWQDIYDGKVPGEDWNRWYENHLLELVEKIEGEATSLSGESEALREVLRPTSFESVIAEHVPGFIGREWVSDAYEHWLNEQPESRLFWIKAGPGVGKTAIAANLAANKRGSIVSSWFCNASSFELKNPRQVITTMAYQWALRWEDYRVRLLRQLGIKEGSTSDWLDEVRRDITKRSFQDLFHHLITEPLANLIWREHKLVVVIDALDEATDENGHNFLAEFLANQLSSLPKWVGFVVTSRPEPAIIAYLGGFKTFTIDALDTRSLNDLQLWIETFLLKIPTLALLPENEQKAIQDLLIERSEGMMLFLKLVELGLRDGSLDLSSLNTLDKGLAGLGSRYYDSFRLRFGEDYTKSNVKPLLRLLLASLGPLPEEMAREVLGWNMEQFQSAKVDLGSYMTETLEGLQLFHKTLCDWLVSSASNKFMLDPSLARQEMATVLFNELARMKQGDSFGIRWRNQMSNWLVIWLPSISQARDATSLNALGLLLNDLGRYSESESLFRQALEILRSTFEEGHPDIANVLANLAAVYTNTSQFTEAEFFFRKSLNAKRMALSIDNNDIAATLHDLAELLRNTGGYEEAESLAREALVLFKSAKAPDDQVIAFTLTTLANILSSTGRYDEAERFYRESLDIYQSNSKCKHPRIAMCFNNLANMFQYTGRLEEAESMSREALEIFRATFPSAHPHIATGLTCLARVLIQTGRYDEAEVLTLEALDIRQSILPVSHETIGASLVDLARIFVHSGRHEEAERAVREALEIFQYRLPKDHHDMVVALNLLAQIFLRTGRDTEAEPLLREVLGIRQSILPAEHPDIGKTLSDIGGILFRAGRFDEAEPLYRMALSINQSCFPADHPAITESINFLALVLVSNGSYAEAESLFREVLAIRTRMLPKADQQIGHCLCALASLLYVTHRHDEAEELFQRALGILRERETQPEDHMRVATILIQLGEILENKDQQGDAKSYFSEALKIFRSILPSEHPLTMVTEDKLSQLDSKP